MAPDVGSSSPPGGDADDAAGTQDAEAGWTEYEKRTRTILGEEVPRLTRQTLDAYFAELNDEIEDAEKEKSKASGNGTGSPGADAGDGGTPTGRTAAGARAAGAATPPKRGDTGTGFLELLLGKRT